MPSPTYQWTNARLEYVHEVKLVVEAELGVPQRQCASAAHYTTSNLTYPGTMAGPQVIPGGMAAARV
jgi:hypothetical protein